MGFRYFVGRLDATQRVFCPVCYWSWKVSWAGRSQVVRSPG